MPAPLILFEDDYFVAAKPAGLSSQATLDSRRPHFFGELRRIYPQLALHHRLDRDTSGVMIFAKNPLANASLGELFRRHEIQKTYLCLCARRPGPDHFSVRNHLASWQRRRRERERMIVVQSGGLFAHTDFRVLEKFPEGLLVEARPHTGRMHQIRVHLSSRGLGIFGDDLYASPAKPLAPRLMLHAWSLELTHPFTHRTIRIEAPVPTDFRSFQDVLKT